MQQSTIPDPDTQGSIEVLIDETVATSAYKYREVAYVRRTRDTADEIDEARATGGPPQERAIERVFAENLRQQESMRTRFTLALLVLFGFVVGFTLIASLTPNWANAKDAVLIVLPTVTGLVGFAVGFYFMTIFGGRPGLPEPE